MDGPMGKVTTRVRVTNQNDVENVRRGLAPPESVRSLEVDALVDTGATLMALPSDLCERLGLAPEGTRKVRYADGRVAEIPWVASVRIEIVGRTTVCEALVEAVGTAPLIGQIPLEAVDLVVDSRSREVRVNPASPDAPLLDLLGAGACAA